LEKKTSEKKKKRRGKRGLTTDKPTTSDEKPRQGGEEKNGTRKEGGEGRKRESKLQKDIVGLWGGGGGWGEKFPSRGEDKKRYTGGNLAIKKGLRKKNGSNCTGRKRRKKSSVNGKEGGRQKLRPRKLVRSVGKNGPRADLEGGQRGEINAKGERASGGG